MCISAIGCTSGTTGCARYERRITGQGERRALVAPTGGLVADDSRGWLRGARLDVPLGGGELVLPSGAGHPRVGSRLSRPQVLCLEARMIDSLKPIRG